MTVKRSAPIRRKTPLATRASLRRGRLRPVNPRRKAKLFRQQFGSVERVEWVVTDPVEGRRPCVSCGAPATDASHARHGSAKTADDLVPQCHECHMDLHSRGIETHQRDRQVDLVADAARFAKMWRERKPDRTLEDD